MPPFDWSTCLLRAPKQEDVSAVTALCVAYDVARFGEAETTEEDILNLWNRINLQHDAWVIESMEGALIGMAVCTKQADQYPSMVLVHPMYSQQGVVERLLEAVEKRICEKACEAGQPLNVILQSNHAAETVLFGQNGFVPVRYWWRMHIDLKKTDLPLDPPCWPEGIHVRTFVPGQDELAAHAAFDEAFRDHWGNKPLTPEEFTGKTQKIGFDPTLWFLVMEGDEIVSFVFCERFMEDKAEVVHLAVRPAWRKKGLGLTMLQHVFHTFAAQNRHNISLSVDSESLTGATRLYEKAGMSAIRTFVRMDKTIHPK